MKTQQYYVTLPNKTQEGPYSKEALFARYRAGNIPEDAMVWDEEMRGWVNIRQWVLTTPPPLPPSLPPSRMPQQPLAVKRKTHNIYILITIGLLLAGGATYGIFEWQKEQARIEANAEDEHNATPLIKEPEEKGKKESEAPIKAEAEVNAKDENGNTALMKAAANGNTERVKALLNAGANVNAKLNDGITALMFAVVNGHTDIVKALLNAGADVNAKDENGVTALMAAVANGHTDCAKALLDAGADVNAMNNAGGTALMCAAGYGHTDCVKALLNASADVNAKNNRGGTALMVAAEKGHTDSVRALLNAGANVNAKLNDGVTALMAAVVNGHTDIVKALLDAGAEDNGKTVLTLARSQGYTNIVRLLQEAEGKGERQKEDEIDPFGYDEETIDDEKDPFGDDEEEETPKPRPKKQAFKPLEIRDFKNAKKDIREAMQKAEGSKRSLLDETADIADAFINIENDIALIRKQNATDKKQLEGLGSWVTKSSKSAGARRKIQELELGIERRNVHMQKKAEELVARAQKAEAKLQKAGQKEYADFLRKAIRTLRRDADKLW